MGKASNEAGGIFPVMGAEVDRSGYALVDLTRQNPALTELPVGDLDRLEQYLEDWKRRCSARFLWGGYGEKRYFYQSSAHFGQRNIHLGVDIWGPAGTPVFAPMDGIVHSQAYNDNYRDYGATILLQHEWEGQPFISLYGHLSKESLLWRKPGDIIRAGDLVARLGDPSENGGWIPHLHLQWILGEVERCGDFPGVCSEEEWPEYRKRCPDPAFLVFVS